MSDIKTIVEDSFERYAGNVILNRAICDARDMLKPSARMLMYSQLAITKNIPSKPFVKSARVVGDALGHYYEHGDSSCYSTYMRMAKPFAMRYPLEDCQGSSGTLNATDDQASMRYTELRLSELGYRLFEDINKNTITNWSENFDKTESYPKVSCSKGFYNIVNGTIGLGIAISSSIPQFNLKETNEALIKLLWNSDVPFDEIYCAPDFATGALLLNANEVKESIKKGSGASAKIRSVVEYDEKKRCFKVTEIPYGIYTETISKQIQKLCEEKPDCGIAAVNDASHKKADYEIYLEKNANPDKVLKLLYKETSLQSYFTINMTALDKGKQPKVMGWRELLQAHLDHEKEVYTRSFQFDLNKIRSRLHIIGGLIAAYDMIDEVIHTIKTASSSSAANVALQSLLSIDEEQAKAILDLKLSRLSKLDISKLYNEKAELEKEETRISAILSDETLLKREIEKGLREVANKFGDARRTKVLNVSQGDEEPTEITQLQVSISNIGNIYTAKTSTLYSQRRGGVGNKLKLDKNEYIISSRTVNSNEELLVFTQLGNVYHFCVADLPIDAKVHISRYAPLVANEEICDFIGASPNSSAPYILFFTKNGFIKKSELSEYNISRSGGVRALALDDGDRIVRVIFADIEKVGVATKSGNFVMFETDTIRPIGRVARGVRAISLNEGDEVCAAAVIPSTTHSIASITADGLFKQTLIDDFALQGRGTKGAKIQKLNDGDYLASFCPIVDGAEHIMVASTDSCIKLSTSDIPTLSRATVGIKSIKLQPKAKVVEILSY